MTTVKEVIEDAYTKVNGEYEELLESSDDFKTYLVVLNQVMEAWALWPYVKWQSLFDVDYDLGTTSADQLEYDVDGFDRIVIANTPMDNIYLVDGDGKLVKTIKLVDQAQFQSSTSSEVAAMLGSTLYFHEITEEMEDLNIKLPAYVLPDKFTKGSDEVVIDSLAWLKSYMAAFISDASPVPFIARNADKFYKQAEVFMKAMKDNNRHSQKMAIIRAGGGTNDRSNLSFIERIKLL